MSEAGSVCIRGYREGDGAAINRGFERTFGRPRSLEEWEWKFATAIRERTMMVAEMEGEVVAHFAALPVELQVGGRRIRAGQVVDVFSTRRQGLFLRLVGRFYREMCGPDRLQLIYGFPGERHFRLGTRKLRYSEPVPVGFWSRDLRANGRGRVRRGLVWRSTSLRWGPDPAMADLLWHRAAHRYPVAGVRDRGWVERRFLGRPGVRYLHLMAWQKGQPAALAIVRCSEEERIAHWAELVWDGRDPRVLERLETEIGGRARRCGAEACHLWLRGDPEVAGLLAERGWIESREPQGLHLGAVSFLPDLDAPTVCRQLYLTMGDADLV